MKSRVSRRWYNLSREKSLWRRLDVTGKLVTVQKLAVFIRKPMAQHMVSLRIEGYLQKLPSSKKNTVTQALFRELQDRCTNLRELHIVHANIENVTLGQFPPTLTFISLFGSMISFNFFEELADPRVLPALNGLDLSYCHNLSSLSRSLPGLLSGGNLIQLRLKHCYKISKAHLCEIPQKMPNLEALDVSDLTNIDDDFLVHAAEFSTKLKELNLSFSQKISDKGMETLGRSAGRIPLEKLYLIEDTQISDRCLPFLAKIKSLEFLSLVKTACTSANVELLKKELPNCKIDVRYSEASEKIGDTFWFVPIKEDA